ncbi:putative serine/threonine protein kinase [Myxococcus stipitatus DSM 14675]|uniref:Putative serine/threonine protein kinase n=1 Tax=Myxococcus stipitatus (strain DSM 14675 / JCM 12634 / Mx s8) TaxID=1278073 RepID=L7U2E5_MYXSD|nr:serine/threonine-protein kinase [Myxococcus stipitatus]AGC41777.1 putative serine/threonine protein kinase [Myxococcus stipitatus DSM 14675]
MARPVEPEPLAGPVRFGPYTLVRRIGAGGMGEVFLAREESPRRACVVKKVLPQLMQSPQFVGRFRDEARVVVRLDHPNIARVYAMGEVDGQLYLSMEYVRGKTLSRLSYRLRQLGRMMPLGIVLHLGQRLCEGLGYAHDATDEEGHGLHLVHRDLSPANVCISYSGEVKIIDFGAAQSTLKEQQTAPRVVIGNLTYMSPEQARKRFVDRRADLYAVGVLLWELCAWKPLSQRGDPVERWRRAAYPQWEPAGKFREGLPSSVDAFLAKALAPEPANRFPDGAAMGAELARLKAKLSSGMGDAELARLMALVFPREKKAEETLLEELLREEARRTHTEPELAATLTPPTALAFEHNAIEAPDDFIPSERVQLVHAPGSGEDEPTHADRPPVAAEHAPSDVRRDADDDEPTAVAPPPSTSTVDPAVTMPLGAEEIASRTAQYGTALEEEDSSRAVAPRPVQVVEATEALDAAKVLVAIEQATAVRASGSRESLFPGSGEDTATPPMPATPPPPRRTPRVTQVGFGVDISQTVATEAIEARRLALVRAITGDGEAPAVASESPAVDAELAEVPQGPRVWLAVAVFAGASLLGLAVAWLTVWR